MPMAIDTGAHSAFQSTHQVMPPFLSASHELSNVNSVNELQNYQVDSADRFSLPSVSHGFSSWANWGGHWLSDPKCYSLKDEGLDVFTVGLDGHIYYRAGHSGKLQNWLKLDGPPAKNPPAVAVQRDGSIDVVIHGTDNIIYYARRDPHGSWQSFETLNFKSYHRPAVAPWYNRGLFIFAIGTDRQMYKLERRHEKWWHGNSGNDWVCFGGSWSGGVTGGYISGSALSNSVYALAYDTNGYLQYTRFHVQNPDDKLGNWVGKWINLQIQGTHAPAVSARPNGFDVAIRSKSGEVAVNSYNLKDDGWLGWAHLGLSTNYIPGIASHSSGQVHVFALDYFHLLHYCTRGNQGASFGSWSFLGGLYFSSPSALVRENKFVDVFILDGVRTLRHSSMTF